MNIPLRLIPQAQLERLATLAHRISLLAPLKVRSDQFEVKVSVRLLRQIRESLEACSIDWRAECREYRRELDALSEKSSPGQAAAADADHFHYSGAGRRKGVAAVSAEKLLRVIECLAYQYGFEDYRVLDDVEEAARLLTEPKLAQAYRAGWAEAARLAGDNDVNEITLFSLALLYFLPSVIAHVRDRQFMPIFVLNTLLGWLVIPWLIALIWALTDQAQGRRA